MNSTFFSNTFTTAAAIMFLGSLVSQGAQANELLPQAHYADQLDRCVAEIRGELNVAADELLQHRVTGVDKGHIWYEFTIETSGAAVDTVSTCRAWRFEDRAIAELDDASAGAAQLAENR